MRSPTGKKVSPKKVKKSPKKVASPPRSPPKVASPPKKVVSPPKKVASPPKATSPKKSRGRPRKNPITDATSPKKSRGRPRKDPADKKAVYKKAEIDDSKVQEALDALFADLEAKQKARPPKPPTPITQKLYGKPTTLPEKRGKSPKGGKACPKDKVLNPATGRCVAKTGKVGKSLLGK